MNRHEAFNKPLENVLEKKREIIDLQFVEQTTHHKFHVPATVNQKNKLKHPSLLLLNCMKWIQYWCITAQQHADGKGENT